MYVWYYVFPFALVVFSLSALFLFDAPRISLLLPLPPLNAKLREGEEGVDRWMRNRQKLLKNLL